MPRAGMVFSSLKPMFGAAAADVIFYLACPVEGSRIGTQSGGVVEGRDGRHVLLAQLEIEHVEVTRYPVGVHRLRDDDITQL